MQAVPVTEAISRSAGEYIRQYRSSHTGIGTPDYLIAATTAHQGARLATLNARHFPMFEGLQAPFSVP